MRNIFSTTTLLAPRRPCAPPAVHGPDPGPEGLVSRGCIVARSAEEASASPGLYSCPPHARRTRGPHSPTALCLHGGTPGADTRRAGRAGSEGLTEAPGRSPKAASARWSGALEGAGRKGRKFLPGELGGPNRRGRGLPPQAGGDARGGGWGWGRRGRGRQGGGRSGTGAGAEPGPGDAGLGLPIRGEGRLTEIDVSEGAAADLPAQPVPVPHSELHGGGGGATSSLLPSRPLPGSELGEAAPLLPLLRVRLPAPPPSRPRFHHRFPAAPPLPTPQYGTDGTVRAPPPLLRPLPTPLALSPPRMDSDLPGLNPLQLPEGAAAIAL